MAFVKAVFALSPAVMMESLTRVKQTLTAAAPAQYVRLALPASLTLTVNQETVKKISV
jgi:hypothetical protein